MPCPGPDEALPTPTQTIRLMRRQAQGGAGRAQAQAQSLASNVEVAPGLVVVNRSPADGALLVEPLDEAAATSIDAVRDRAPAGARVYEEHWYRLDRPAWPWRRQGCGWPPRARPAGAACQWPWW